MTLAYDIETLHRPQPRARSWLLAAALVAIAALAVQSPAVREIVLGLLAVGAVWAVILLGMVQVAPPPPED